MKRLTVVLMAAFVLCGVSAVPALAEEATWIYGDSVNEVTAAGQWVHSVHHRIFIDNDAHGSAGAPVCEALTLAEGSEGTLQYTCGYGEVYRWNGNCSSQVWAWAANNYSPGGPAMRVWGEGKTC